MHAQNARWMRIVGGMVGVMLAAGVGWAAPGGLPLCEAKESRQNKLTTSIHGNPGEPGLSEIDDQVILAGLLI